GGVEQREGDEPCAAVAEVLERHRLDDHMTRHAVPLERLHHAFGRRHFAIAAFEAMHAVFAVLDEAPMASALHLHALDDEPVPPPPPLRHERGIAERLPDAVARRVEDALDPDLAV